MDGMLLKAIKFRRSKKSDWEDGVLISFLPKGEIILDVNGVSPSVPIHDMKDKTTVINLTTLFKEK
jgi:hypothetical protein